MATRRAAADSQLALPLPRRRKAAARADAGLPEPTLEQKRHFQRILDREAQRPWRVIWTNNRSTMISYRRDRQPPVLRLHRLFAVAPESVWVGIVHTIEGRRRGWPAAVDRLIAAHIDRIRAAAERRHAPLRPQGAVYDLTALLAKLNKAYFQKRIHARVGWMSAPSRRQVSVKLGSYAEESDTIRLHPVLDQRQVPAYVVESVLFHEMVHALLKTRMVNGRRIAHGRDFKALEASYPKLEQAERWLEQHQALLMRGAPRRRKTG